MSVKDVIFWSEIGSGFGEPQVAHPHQEFPGIPPPQGDNHYCLLGGQKILKHSSCINGSIVNSL